MRTLLICTGLCLTAGTFIAAERLTASTAQASVLEQEAALEERVKQSTADFTAEIAALEGAKNTAEARVAKLTNAVKSLSADRENLAAQVAAAKSEANSALTELQTANLGLMQDIEVKEASLAAKDAELEDLNARIATLAESTSSAASEELQAEVASLTSLLAERDETISLLESQAGDTASYDAVDPAVVNELAAAKTTIAKTEARLAAISETLSVRDATIDRLEASLVAKEAEANEESYPVAESTADNEATSDDGALETQIAELTALLETQTKTISDLRMGFEEDMGMEEMANACIERASKIFEISQIKFATGTSTISEQSTVTLDHLRDLAIGCESDEMFIEIGGHTDSLGAEASNQKLSEARANAVRDFLIGRGIPAETMVAVGFGESQPIASNDTQTGRAQNRRISFTWQMREKTAESPETTTENADG